MKKIPEYNGKPDNYNWNEEDLPLKLETGRLLSCSYFGILRQRRRNAASTGGPPVEQPAWHHQGGGDGACHQDCVRQLSKAGESDFLNQLGNNQVCLAVNYSGDEWWISSKYKELPGKTWISSEKVACRYSIGSQGFSWQLAEGNIHLHWPRKVHHCY